MMTNEKQERAHRVFECCELVVKTSVLLENKLFGRDVAELVSGGVIRKIKTGY